MSTDPFDGQDNYKDLGELTEEALERNQDAPAGTFWPELTVQEPRITVAEMAAGLAARIDPPTEARVQEAANHRVGSRRDKEFGEFKARLDKVEGKTLEALQAALQLTSVSQGIDGNAASTEQALAALIDVVGAQAQGIAELRGKVHKLEGELDLVMESFKLQGESVRLLTGLVRGLQGDLTRLSNDK